MKRRTACFLLTLVLVLCLCPMPAAGEGSSEGTTKSTFAGVVTYRSGKEAYLQNGTEAVLAMLDSTNSQADLDAVQVGKHISVSGESMTLKRAGYHIPEIADAMIVAVDGAASAAAPVSAGLDELNDALMARLVRVKGTKEELATTLQLSLEEYAGRQTLTVTGVLSANTKGRILLGVSIQAEHVPGEPVRENEVAATCTEAGSYDEVVYCAHCGAELSRETKRLPALGHAPGEPVRENEVPATHEAEGSYDEVVYCTRCGSELSREHKIIDKLPVPPTIAQQPKDVKAKSGAKAKFTVKTKEKDVSFQWFVKAPGANDWEALKGGAKNTLIVIASKANNGAQYRCLVKNKEGGEVYTNAVKLTVTLQPPVIKTQPKDQNVKSGAKAKLSVKASGKNITYQWYERANADSEWKAVSGGNRNTLNVVASKANDGHQYYCYLKNADGEAKSITVTLTVKTEAPTIKTQPKNQNVKGGAKAKFSVKAGGKNLKYQWYERANADAEWTAVSGGTKSSLQVVASKAKNGYQYYCKVTNPDGTASSAVVTLTVTSQPPKFSTQPKDVKVKVGAKAKFKVKASGKNVTYQWYYRENENAEWKAFPGATKASYEIKKVAAENIGWQFKCLAKNVDGEVWSKVATLLQK